MRPSDEEKLELPARCRQHVGRVSRRHFVRLGAAAGTALLLPNGSRAAEAGLPSLPAIEVQKEDWGNASIADIAAVLKSAAGEIWRHCRSTRLDSIRVYFRAKGPITDFKRAPDGKILIGLNVKDRHWAQFT